MRASVVHHTTDAKQKANDQKDIFAGYKGRVDEI
jgi:hypothetical protein